MKTAARAPIAITGLGWEIPALGRHNTLSQALQHAPQADAVFAPELQLGKKGLRYKERATLLALCAARTALQHADLLPDSGALDDAHFGVVIASNTGNLDTVCQAADTIRREHVNATSSMDLPNASSNVVASTIAIRFGLQAMNLMICSGAAASLDALIVAANAIRNGRARRMLVGSVETDGLALRSLLAQQRLPGLDGQSPLLEGAASVILESLETAEARGAVIHGLLSDHAFAHADAADQDAMQRLFQRHLHKSRYLGAGSFLQQHAGVDDPSAGPLVDLGERLTGAYGSATLLQLIHACEQLQGGTPGAGFKTAGHGAVLVGGGTWRDRRAGAVVVERQQGPQQ